MSALLTFILTINVLFGIISTISVFVNRQYVVRIEKAEERHKRRNRIAELERETGIAPAEFADLPPLYRVLLLWLSRR